MHPWSQVYDPLHFWPASTLLAALPIVFLLALLAIWQVRPHRAAAWAAALALAVATLGFGMPWRAAVASFGFGAAFGLFKIAWIVIAAVFLYELTVATGQFAALQRSLGQVSRDHRLLALLIAFSLGAFLEGAAGFGAPVAIAGAFLVGLGFEPFQAAIVCLVANTAPVAFGSIGIPIHVLVAVSGLPEPQVAAMVGRILPLVSPVVAFWTVRLMCTWAETWEVLPAILVAGGSFGLVQFAWSNFMNPSLTDIFAALASLASLTLFLRVWQPRSLVTVAAASVGGGTVGGASAVSRQSFWSRARAYVPFVLLSAMVLLWGAPNVKAWMDHTTVWVAVPGLDGHVMRTLPVVARPTPEVARFDFTWLSGTGTSVFFAALLTALALWVPPGMVLGALKRSLVRMRWAMLAIACMLGLSYVTRYSGMDAVLGLAFTRTGRLYPFFGTFLGWLGVALTGSDTASNALFGSLQRLTAEQLKLSPILMTAANSAGGVMGKMIDAQSIVVATAATDQVGNEGRIFRKVFWHSVALGTIVALIVVFYAFVAPGWVPKG